MPIGERVKIAMSINDGNEKGIESSNNGPLPFNNTGNIWEIDACTTVFYSVGTLDPVDLDEAPLASFYSIASRVQLRSTLNHSKLCISSMLLLESRGKSQGSKSESKDQTGQVHTHDEINRIEPKEFIFI